MPTVGRVSSLGKAGLCGPAALEAQGPALSSHSRACRRNLSCTNPPLLLQLRKEEGCLPIPSNVSTRECCSCCFACGQHSLPAASPWTNVTSRERPGNQGRADLRPSEGPAQLCVSYKLIY